MTHRLTIAEAAAELLERQLTSALLGPLATKPRPTALRIRGRSFETVELDDAGNIIEPRRCRCGGMIAIHQSNCPFFGVCS